jgi:vacuolar protein sorting-associated protein 13A/C
MSIIDGHVGYLRIEIPWLHLATQPVKIELEDVFLVIQPNKCVPFDAEKEKQRALEIKRKKIRRHKTKSKLKKPKKEDVLLEDDPSFITRLGEKMLNNLQFIIKRLHIRYEDDSNHNAPIIAGLTLAKLEVQSCNEDWEVTFAPDYGDIINKIVSIEGLALYINPKDTFLFSAVKTHEDFCNQMRRLIDRDKSENDYVTPCASATIRLRMQRSGHLNLDEPKILVQLFAEKLSITLKKSQYHLVLLTLEYLSNHENFDKV